jgi:hypothetical protein
MDRRCRLWLMSLTLAMGCVVAAHGDWVVGSWEPLFQGVDHALGLNTAYSGTQLVTNQVVHVLRLDLADPDLELVTDLLCTNCPAGKETRGSTTSGFLEAYDLQGAINGNFSVECCSEKPGDPMTVLGLLISQGQVVSPAWTPADPPVHSQTYFATLLFTTNKQPIFIASNWPPVSLDGIYTAVAGNVAVLTNGVFTGIPSDVDPRTGIGISADGRYLFLVTIDGRQPGYSLGATFEELAVWMALFGASDALAVDGGGATTMVIAQCPRTARQLNVPIDRGIRGKERVIAAHLGFRAKPLPGPIGDLRVEVGTTNATISWTTPVEATTQVAYGLSTAYDRFSPFDPTPSLFHQVTLGGLLPTSNYFFRVISTTPTDTFTADSCFRTVYYLAGTLLEMTNAWKYTAGNLDDEPWQAPDYDDSEWAEGLALLCFERDALPAPKNTVLPINPTTGYPYITYYFRTGFTYTNPPPGTSLLFSNYIDDGAVFYLNGVEVHRFLMPRAPQPIRSDTLATGYPCSGDATCPYVFTLAGPLITNLVQGDNVLAVEVHNWDPRSSDIVFGCAVHFVAPPPPPPPPFVQELVVRASETEATITWTTPTNATTQVEYGLTPALGTYTPLDPALVTNHTVTLTGLVAETNYFFRAISAAGGVQYAAEGVFYTTLYVPLVNLTNLWRFTTNNLDGIAWQRPDYDDSGWLGAGPALLAVEDNPDVQPNNTPLPGVPRSLPPTYYFRTRFHCPVEPRGLTLLLSNVIDDGAVFYLNGAELLRVRMAPAPQPITYTTLATSTPPFGDALYPEVVRLSGKLLTNLVPGDNVLAVEVHQNARNSSDIVFGTIIGLVRPDVTEADLRISRSGDLVCLEWNGTNFTLQQASVLGHWSAWTDVPGPVNRSPYCLTNPPATRFYRLRK